MKRHEIEQYINEISPTDMVRWKGLLPGNVELINELYALAKQIEPCDAYRNGTDRLFWLTADDEQTEQAWFKLYLAEHGTARAIWLDRTCFYNSKDKDFDENVDITPLLRFLIEKVGKCVEMIKAGTYTEYVRTYLPYRQRSGVIQLKTYWDYVPEDKERWFRTIDQKELEEFLHWKFHESSGVEEMTADDYFRACDYVYDLLNEKNDDPKNHICPADSPRERYIANVASVFDVDRFLSLDERSPIEFADYISSMQESHVWEIDWGRSIVLRPVLVNGRYFLEFLFGYRSDDYGLRIHIELELSKKGVPIRKSSDLIELLSGEIYTAITPYSTAFDSKSAKENGFTLTEVRCLPEEECSELIQKVTWFPITMEWRPAPDEDSEIGM